VLVNNCLYIEILQCCDENYFEETYTEKILRCGDTVLYVMMVGCMWQC